MYERIFRNKKTTFLALLIGCTTLPLVYLGKASLLEVTGAITSIIVLLFSKDKDVVK